MKNYYRLMLGKGSSFAEDCRSGNFIGMDFLSEVNLSALAEDWRAFNQEFVPVFRTEHPDKSKIAAGLACGASWTLAKRMQKGDAVLCPNGSGSYFVGEVTDDYSYHANEILPHRRTVRWLPVTIERSRMSEALQRSSGSIATICELTKYAQEIETLISGTATMIASSPLSPESEENPIVFALEKHLEDFLVRNWQNTELGRNYDIFEEDGELVGQQYQSDTGAIDILAISKDKRELLVVELKRGRASDAVVGQIQRYMGFVIEELAEEGQTVKGIIIALEDDLRIRRALKVANNIEFFRYEVNFKLVKN